MSFSLSEDLVGPLIIGVLLLILWGFVELPTTKALGILAGTIGVVGLLAYFDFARKEAGRRRAELAARAGLRARAASVATESDAAAGRLAQRYRDASGWLDAAEAEFAEGAFAPFWDAIEMAVRHLGDADAEMARIAGSIREYQQVLGVLDEEPPPLVVGVLPSAAPITDRLRGIVRRAQKSFEFATIYEQRRTNQILIAGFTSLGEAIERVGDRLAENLEELGTRLDELIQFQDTRRSDREEQERLGRIRDRRRDWGS